jgi:polyketide biosynthesis acyl carrier protein
MDKNDIFTIIKKNLLEILPGVDESTVRVSDSLRELGANSVDRAEILIQTMADLKLKIPLVEFGGVKNIEGITEIFLNNMSQQK